MRKFLTIIILSFLVSGNAYASCYDDLEVDAFYFSVDEVAKTTKAEATDLVFDFKNKTDKLINNEVLFYKMINKPTTKTLIIRFLAFIPFIFLSSSSVTWIFDPILAASSFGFDFKLLSDYGKNTLIRDMTAFFLGLSLFMLLGIITLNQTWFFSVSVVMSCAFLFNLIAVYFHETNQNSAFVFEFVVAFWFLCLGLWLKNLKINVEKSY